MYTQALTSMESYHRNLITSWNSLPDSDIWQVSYTRARRSFSIIKYQMTIKNYVKRRYLALETIIIT